MVPHRTSTSEHMDKIDMSLDDIIKLNKQEQNKELFNGRSQSNPFQQFRSGWGGWGFQRHPGAGGNIRTMGMKRRPYGVKTGLAAWKMGASWKGISPLNRPPLSEWNSPRQQAGFRKRMNLPRLPDFGRKSVPPLQRYYFRSNYVQANASRSGFRMNQQRETRQATFLLRRGLKVQTLLERELEREQHLDFPELNRNHPWRTSMTSVGNLTVSIDNPSAITLPSSLGPRLPRPPLPFLTNKEGSEPKIPKGVPLEFDINSVAKQTGITLNERFKILKEQRLSQPLVKGSRFVTVG